MLFASLLTGALAECASEDPQQDTEICPIGIEGCACTQGGTCDPGLVCLSMRCVIQPPETSTTDGDVCLPGMGGCTCAEGDACEAGYICEATTCVMLEPGCGDAIVNSSEECDEGAANGDNGACTSACKSAACGDGFVYIGVEDCDDGGESATCNADCTVSVCGDATLNEESGEQCDDGNKRSGDGCEADCELPFGAVVSLSTSGHYCVVSDTGLLRCWGEASSGQLGLGDEEIGVLGNDPGEMPPPNVDVGGAVIQADTGMSHTCALLRGGDVRCWGQYTRGRLGNMVYEDIGDDELPSAVDPVVLGGAAVHVAAGGSHTCALLEGGDVRCWGWSLDGRLGYADSEDIGDDEAPGDVGPVSLGGPVTQLVVGDVHNCALLDGGAVRCWGLGMDGRLGQGNSETIGDDELPVTLPPINLGEPAVQLAAGGRHNCALMQSGEVLCWGSGKFGELGYENTEAIGDEPGEMPPPAVVVGGTVLQLAAGGSQSCALLESGAVRCWGRGLFGGLGYGNSEDIGDQPGEMPPANIDLGGPVKRLALGTGCVLLEDGSVRCWGYKHGHGQLGMCPDGCSSHPVCCLGDEPGEMPPPPMPIE